MIDLPPTGHDPVLLDEILELLPPQSGANYVACTTGRGGHASAFAERLKPDGQVIALDVDPQNLTYAGERIARTGCPHRLFHANFAELDEALDAAGIAQVDLILADLGLSTNQLFDERYGLSFAQPMPLDMRIDPRIDRTAADYINQMREEDLANALYQLADERFSRRIARKIVEARKASPINTTERLADLVRQAVPSRGGAPGKIDPATRSFLALRMLVNREVENLEALLKRAPNRLKPGGRFGVISFQSTEDRIVKQAFRSAEQTGLLQVLTKKPLCPTDAEIARNPRSRSAKLRVVQKRQLP